MRKIFAEAKINPVGKVLPIDKFVPFLDIENREFNEERIAAVIKAAEKYLEEPVPQILLSTYRAYQITGSVGVYSSPYHKRRIAAINLAFAEHYEKKGRFTAKLCDYVWAILEETSWVVPEHYRHYPAHPLAEIPPTYNKDDLHGIDLFSAATCATMTAIYVYAKDALDSVSPIISNRLRYEILERSVKPYLNSYFWWGGELGNRVNNWCPWVNSNILYVTANLETDHYKRTRVVEKALNQLDNFTSRYEADGGCDEGATYWGVAGGALFDCLEIIYDMTGGEIDMFSDPLVKAIGEFEPKFNIHERYFINFADCSPKVYLSGAMIARFGRRCHSEILESFGNKTDSLAPAGEMGDRSVYRTVKDMYEPKISGQVECLGATRTWFENLKVMVSRESKNTSEGLFLAMKGGNNQESHNHNDVGSFIVYYGGKPVLIDCGVLPYTKDTFSARRYTIWCTQSGFHNLPVIDSFEQKPGTEYCSTDEHYDEATGGVSMEIGTAYPKEAGIVSYRRSAVLEGGKATVQDSFTLEREASVDVRFMTHREPKLLQDGQILLAEDRVLSFDKELEVEIEKFLPERMNPTVWDSEYLWKIHLKTTAKSGTLTFKIE